MLRKKRQCCADPQDDGEKVGEFAGETEQQMLAGDFLDMVGPEFHQPARRFRRSEAGARGVQAGEGLLDAETMNRHEIDNRSTAFAVIGTHE